MKILFLGTGLMGAPMVEKLLAARFDVTVYNRTKSKTKKIIDKGAKRAADLLDAVNDSDVVISMLSDYPAFNELMDDNCLSALNGKTLIQMSTISPEESLLLLETVEDIGGRYIEAPVLGSLPQIESGKLIVMVGGSEELFNKYQKIFSSFGEKIYHMGEVGQATAAKLALNQLIASLTIAFSMSLGYILNKKVDIDKFMNILRSSALYASTFDKKLENMLNRDYGNPNFPVKHLLKDVRLIVREFGANAINISPLIGIEEVIMNSIAAGDGELDYSAVFDSVVPVE